MPNHQTLNRTGLYLRLSRDDEKEGESLSIENQRMILRKYVAEHEGIVAGEYIDDGWSGTDFERPAVKSLLEDAKNGKIDTIIVKDLSRFGRNYIQVGQYIDYIFPACGIRFIALADNVDTADRTSPGMDMMPIMNVFNEWHAANTSKKIRAVLEANWKKGKYTNWAYPYGYTAGKDEKRTAVVDEDAAKIVRRIYDMRLQGISARTIAKTLTEEGIPTPTAHYIRMDGKKSERKSSPFWSPKTVADILKDKTYTGTLTQHRTTRFSYKNHKVINLPESEQIVKEHAHEAIIDPDLWERVQAIGKGASRGRADKSNTVHPLSGLLICADCGKKLKFKSHRGRNNSCGYYVCRTYADLGKKYCTSHAISERDSSGIVLQDLRSLLDKNAFDEEAAKAHFLHKKNKCTAQNKISARNELNALRARVEELEKLISAAFEDKVRGDLPENVCKNLCEKYQAEKDRAEKRIADREKYLSEKNEPDTGVEEYMARIKHYLRCEELTREMCLQLIGSVTIGEKTPDTPRQIHICYKFMPGKIGPKNEQKTQK